MERRRLPSSLARSAFTLIKRVTGNEGWDEILRRRAEDLLVYLALARFRRRPPISKLPLALQRDIRAFFGTYKRACQQADELLFQAGRAEAIDEACCRSASCCPMRCTTLTRRAIEGPLRPRLRVGFSVQSTRWSRCGKGSGVQNSKLPRRAFSPWNRVTAAILNSVRLTPGIEDTNFVKPHRFSGKFLACRIPISTATRIRR